MFVTLLGFHAWLADAVFFISISNDIHNNYSNENLEVGSELAVTSLKSVFYKPYLRAADCMNYCLKFTFFLWESW